MTLTPLLSLLGPRRGVSVVPGWVYGDAWDADRMTETKDPVLDAWVQQQLAKAPPVSAQTRAQVARIVQRERLSRPAGR